MTKYALSTLAIAGLLMGAARPALARKAPKAPESNNDRIELAGHVALDGSGVTGVLTATHWRRNYLYLSFAGRITVVDVTDSEKPKIKTEYECSQLAGAGQVRVAVGDSALVAEGAPAAAAVPRSISIMSFADPEKPAVLRQFKNITGFVVDSHRSLIYVVNDEGVWILAERPGRDVEMEQQYERELKYNR